MRLTVSLNLFICSFFSLSNQKQCESFEQQRNPKQQKRGYFMAELMIPTSLRELFTESTRNPHLLYVIFLIMLAKLSDFLSSIDRFLNSLMEGTVIVSGFVISRRSVDLIRMQIFNSCFASNTLIAFCLCNVQ